MLRKFQPIISSINIRKIEAQAKKGFLIKNNNVHLTDYRGKADIRHRRVALYSIIVLPIFETN